MIFLLINLTYKVGLNRFADLTNKECKAMYLDWKEKGVVIPQDQGQCGNELLGFLTVAAVEGISKIVTDDLISLSEQELVDYDTLYNEGCNGGLMDSDFEFFIKNGGIDTEEDYPYRASENLHIFQLQMRHFYAGVSWCSSFRLKNASVVSIDGYEDVPENNENSLKMAMANRSVSVGIEAGGRAIQLYQSGVFSGDCKTNLDHGVVIVGYGTENGVDYWIVRNLWGSN
ncbi:hypothetical protein GOBAR_AA19655 [Gossypium barbadense]|uniref:Peptidase C1A papain C-terminal domain-containing protein n=1 Tax=Gossypium barbadense TaxID=3634 RepID=A0A2P5XCG8_GOSBA|nr:hypothetical protein GOBAR_AA19655 [Gossypium barbadense]